MRINALRVVSELAASQHNVFTRPQAARRGVRRDHLARLIDTGILVPMPSGGLAVLPPDATPTWHQRVVGAVLAHPGTVASHTTAARLDDVDGFAGRDGIELSVLRPRVLKVPGVVVHRVASLDRCDIVASGPIPCTNRARTLCDLGSSVGSAMVERAFDDIVRRGAHPRWLRSTAERLHRPGQRGTKELLRLLDDLERRGRVRDSWFEKLIEDCVQDPAIGEVERQYELRSGDRLVARFDLAVPDAKLAIEGHSRRHHFGAEAEASDEHRDQAVAELGWDVMYLGYASVQSPASVARRVRARVLVRRALLTGGA